MTSPGKDDRQRSPTPVASAGPSTSETGARRRRYPLVRVVLLALVLCAGAAVAFRLWTGPGPDQLRQGARVALEARQRCLDEVTSNIEAFLRGERRNRLD